MPRMTLTISDEDLAIQLKRYRIKMADAEGNIPTWDMVLDELVKRANLEDLL